MSKSTVMKSRSMKLALSTCMVCLVVLLSTSCEDASDEIFNEVENLEQKKATDEEEEKDVKPGEQVSINSSSYSPQYLIPNLS